MFFLSLVVLAISGCNTVNSVPVYVEVENPKKVNVKGLKKDDCNGCKVKKKVVKVPCASSTKVVNYQDKCNCLYSFPVTVRENSNCKKGDAL